MHKKSLALAIKRWILLSAVLLGGIFLFPLTEQNQTISEQLSLLTPKRDALKARYGVGTE